MSDLLLRNPAAQMQILKDAVEAVMPHVQEQAEQERSRKEDAAASAAAAKAAQAAKEVVFASEAAHAHANIVCARPFPALLSRVLPEAMLCNAHPSPVPFAGQRFELTAGLNVAGTVSGPANKQGMDTCKGIVDLGNDSCPGHMPVAEPATSTASPAGIPLAHQHLPDQSSGPTHGKSEQRPRTTFIGTKHTATAPLTTATAKRMRVTAPVKLAPGKLDALFRQHEATETLERAGTGNISQEVTSLASRSPTASNSQPLVRHGDAPFPSLAGPSRQLSRRGFGGLEKGRAEDADPNFAVKSESKELEIPPALLDQFGTPPDGAMHSEEDGDTDDFKREIEVCLPVLQLPGMVHGPCFDRSECGIQLMTRLIAFQDDACLVMCLLARPWACPIPDLT